MYRANANEPRRLTTQNEFPIDISSDEDDIEDNIPRTVNNGTNVFRTFI